MDDVRHFSKGDTNEEIGGSTYILYMPLLLLVCLQDLQELFVRLLVVVVSVLDLAQVVDRMVELAILWPVCLVRVKAA